MAETFLTNMHTTEGRRALAEVVLSQFRHWELYKADQARLLGVESMEPLWQGAPLPDEKNVLERAGLLLAIGRALEQRFVDQPWMQERWIGMPNIGLQGQTPLQRMLEGSVGIREVLNLIKEK